MTRLTFIARFEIDPKELAQSRSDFHYDNPTISDEAVLADDLQQNAYDDGQMHGHFQILKQTYAVIYDRLVNGDWIDDMYEAFSSPEEAISTFIDAYGSDPKSVANPRVVVILDPVPGDWGRVS